jgi:hypothetical protein
VKDENREAWLTAAVEKCRQLLFEPNEMHLPPVIRISTGLCSGKGIGMCMAPECSTDGSEHIFISPELDDTLVIVATVAHELVHVSVGTDCKHKGPFVKAIRELGMAGKPTATYAEPGTEFHATCTGIAASLGEYPHAKLVKKVKKTTKHNWISFISPSNEEYIVRANRNTVKELGPPRDYNGEPMVPKDPSQMEDDDEEGSEG